MVEFTPIEPIWNFIVQRWGGVVSHWLFPSIVGYIAFASFGIYFTLKDIGPWRSVTTRIYRNCLPDAKEICRVAGIQLGAYAILNLVLWQTIPHHVELPASAPSLYEVIRDVTVSLFIGDFLVYLEHIIQHKIPFLYRNVHYVHHRFKGDVFGWAAGWVHPFELTLFGVCMILYPCVVCPIHPLSLWVYEFIFVGLLVEEHSNHDVWWSPGHWVPAIFGGAVPHNVHHIKVKANYGFVFAIWDQIYLPPSTKQPE